MLAAPCRATRSHQYVPHQRIAFRGTRISGYPRMNSISHLKSIVIDRLQGDQAPLSQAQLSQTISFARITLIVGLVFLHYGGYPNSQSSPFDGMDPTAFPLATFANSFVLFFFFSVVPLLSMVSGWLYFTFAAERAAPALRERISRRLGSLYLPLVFWNTIYLALAVLLCMNLPGNAFVDQLNFQPSEAGWREYLNAVFALTSHPIAFQFWFVRDLLVTVLLSPLLWLALRHAPYVGMVVLGAAWLLGYDLVVFFRTDVTFFFYLGGFVRMYKVPLEIGRGATIALTCAYVLLVALRTLAPLVVEVTPQRPELLDMATRAMRPVGVLACWGLCVQLARTKAGAAISRYGGLSFFVFATHFPLIAAVKLMLWPLLPVESDGWMMAHYVASVALTVAITVSTGLLLARFVPGVFALMNGGRVLPVARPASWTGSVPRSI
ncbi:acyltransferase [Lysobacter korlensis]|uniref:Acyltransferase n=1 Tax=Lysobacter korlensis TaxID=553636 RepID=A0ABV6RL73_9GAMM